MGVCVGGGWGDLCMGMCVWEGGDVYVGACVCVGVYIDTYVWVYLLGHAYGIHTI